MVEAKQDSNNSPPQGSPEEPQDNQAPKGDQLQPPTEPPTIPSDGDADPPNLDPQLQQTSAVDTDSIAHDALRAATEAASVALKGDDPEGVSILDQDSVCVPQNQDVSVSRPQQHISANPLSQTSPLDTAVLLNDANSAAAFPQKMDIHDATGTLLHQLGVNGETDPGQQPPQQPDVPAQPQQITQNHQTAQAAAVQEAVQAAQVGGTHPSQHSQQPPMPLPLSSGPIARPIAHPPPGRMAAPVHAPRKPTRMPGTKQCPSCQNTIAAALAKCPKCPHVFREKKEKVKRSGKRGKKNCPKCSFENPSACSSCKNCKYVFRLKLMDKYKQMRPRPTSDTAAAAAAAAAHAAANLTGQHAGVTAVSTVPMHAGVASYPSAVAQPMHPGHAAVSVIPPLTQHPMSIHPHAHNVHATGVPQMHPMPQHPMPHHQTHPQL